MYRTLFCNDIRDEHVGKTVQLAGWVDVIRDHGGVLFVDLRDETGVTQVVVHDETLLKGISKETVISVHGTVTKRDEIPLTPRLIRVLLSLCATSSKCSAPAQESFPLRSAQTIPTRISVSSTDSLT